MPVVKTDILLLLITLCTFLVLLVSNSQPSSGKSEKLDYGPELCADDAGGFVYLAARRIVVRVPYESLTYIQDWPPERKSGLPIPPKPDEPRGCPGNPIQGASFKLGYGWRSASEGTRSLQQLELGLFAARPEFRGMQSVNEGLHERACARNVIENLDSGLIACRVPMEDKSRPRRDWAVSYEANHKVYSAPFDRPFIVNCSLSRGDQPKPCSVSYKRYERLNITYSFSSGAVPPSAFIDLDHELRAWIDLAVVQHYPWRDTVQPKGTLLDGVK